MESVIVGEKTTYNSKSFVVTFFKDVLHNFPINLLDGTVTSIMHTSWAFAT